MDTANVDQIAWSVIVIYHGQGGHVHIICVSGLRIVASAWMLLQCQEVGKIISDLGSGYFRSDSSSICKGFHYGRKIRNRLYAIHHMPLIRRTFGVLLEGR